MFPPVCVRDAAPSEKKGAVYTRDWVVEFILDLVGYTPDRDLVDLFAVEPAAGEGAFLVAMARRLVTSCRRQGRDLAECGKSLLALRA